MQTTGFVVLSGFNLRAVLAICRSFERSGAAYAVLARGDDDPILRTRYRRRVAAWIHPVRLDIPELLQAFGRARVKLGVDRLVLLPTAEYSNRLFLEHRARLEGEAATFLPLPDCDTYLAVSEKKRFSELCSARGIAIPREFPPGVPERFPFAAKPSAEFAADGKRCYPYLVHDDAGRRAFLQRERAGDYYFQEFVGGRSYYLLFYFFRDGRVVSHCQRNGAQQPGGKSIVFAWTEPFPQPELQAQFATLFRDLGFHGLVMVELKGEPGGFRMIEANPRVWGPMQLAQDAGVDLIACYAEEYAQMRRAAPHPRRRPYLWLGGFVQTRTAGASDVWFAGGRRALWRDLARLPVHDIFLRPDSAGLFAHEILGSLRTLRPGHTPVLMPSALPVPDRKDPAA